MWVMNTTNKKKYMWYPCDYHWLIFWLLKPIKGRGKTMLICCMLEVRIQSLCIEARVRAQARWARPEASDPCYIQDSESQITWCTHEVQHPRRDVHVRMCRRQGAQRHFSNADELGSAQQESVMAAPACCSPKADLVFTCVAIYYVEC